LRAFVVPFTEPSDPSSTPLKGCPAGSNRAKLKTLNAATLGSIINDSRTLIGQANFMSTCFGASKPTCPLGASGSVGITAPKTTRRGQQQRPRCGRGEVYREAKLRPLRELHCASE